MLFSPRTGGRTTQFGIVYQNRVAVLRLASLLAQEVVESASLGCVVSVQPEANEEVDDVVVTYSSGRKEYIQVKTDVARKSKAWTMLWQHFYKQFHEPQFDRRPNGDFITLAVGPKARLEYLSDLLTYARDAGSAEDWLTLPGLNEKHLDFRNNIQEILKVDDGELYELCSRIRVWPIVYGVDPSGADDFRNIVQNKLRGIVEPLESSFSALQDFVSDTATRGKTSFFVDVVDFLDSQGISVISTEAATPLLSDAQQQRRKQKIEILRHHLKVQGESSSALQHLRTTAPNEAARQRYVEQLQKLRSAQDKTEQQIAFLETATVLKAEAHRGNGVNPNAPLLGPYVYLMCDRTTQEQQFFSAFLPYMDPNTRDPRMYLIPGPDGENHNSLVARFRYTWIEDYSKTIGDEQKTGVVLWDMAEWPFEGTLLTRQLYLIVALFKKCEPKFLYRKPTEYTVQNFRQLLSSEKNSFIVIQHEIKTWDAETKKLVEWYKDFWEQVKRGEGADDRTSLPQCLIFLSIIYPLSAKPTAKEEQRQKGILDDIETLAETPDAHVLAESDSLCRCVRLEKLSCVKKEHVRSWFENHKIPSSTADPETQYDEMFRTRRGAIAKCKNMREIEGQLRIICSKFATERVNGS